MIPQETPQSLREVVLHLVDVSPKKPIELPFALVNYYQLQDGDALLCRLLQLTPYERLHKPPQEIDKEVLIDVMTNGDNEHTRRRLWGYFSIADTENLKLKDFTQATFHIVEVYHNAE
jgi:hypothetical protein